MIYWDKISQWQELSYLYMLELSAPPANGLILCAYDVYALIPNNINKIQ